LDTPHHREHFHKGHNFASPFVLIFPPNTSPYPLAENFNYQQIPIMEKFYGNAKNPVRK
jgi:hypothetical protein